MDISHINLVQRNAEIIELLKERGKSNTDKHINKLRKIDNKLDELYQNALNSKEGPACAFITF